MRSRLFQLPPVVLAVLLQLAPLVRWMSTPSLLAPQSAWAVVLRFSAGTAALLGAVDAVSGASDTFIALAQTPTPTGTNGAAYLLRLDLSGKYQTRPATWTSLALPQGLKLTGTASNSRFLSGTPTQSGSNWVTVTATDIVDSELRTSKSFAIVVVSAGTAPTITAQPAGFRAVPGADARFSVVAVGTDPLSYQWSHGPTPLPSGTNATLVLTNVSSANVGSYSVVVSNASGTAPSLPAPLSLAQPPTLGLVALATNIVLSFPGQTGVVYRVESATDLGAPVWQFVTNVTTAADLPLSFTNSLSPTGTVFLRLKLQAP